MDDYIKDLLKIFGATTLVVVLLVGVLCWWLVEYEHDRYDMLQEKGMISEQIDWDTWYYLSEDERGGIIWREQEARCTPSN